MRGVMILKDIAAVAALAADVYPHMMQALDDAGVPPDLRAQVLAYIIQVISADVDGKRILQ